MEKLHQYTLLVAYDGTAYAGWQQQEHAVTVAGVICSRFKKVFDRECSIIAASRTDAGVHALGQVARITTDIDIDPQKIMRVLNGSLPQDIHIRSATKSPDRFHPLYNVKYKIYYYHIFVNRPLPQWARYGYHCWQLSRCHSDPMALLKTKDQTVIQKLNNCLQVFVGTHDFRSFATGELTRSTIKTIDSIKLEYDKRMCAYRITFKGQGFLRHMIRRIVGAALYVTYSNLDKQVLIDALAKKDPHQQLPTAPANGLLLRKVVYK